MAKKRKSTKTRVRAKGRRATTAASRIPAWRRAGIAPLSDKDLDSLSPRIDELADVFAEPDTKAILAELDATQPKQRDIDEAVKLGMAVYMEELRDTKRALPSPHEAEQLSGRLEASIRNLHSSMAIDEEAVKKNVLATGFDMGLANDRFFVVRNGEVVVDIGAETRDPRALDWAVIQKIADVFIEVVGLVIGIKGIVAKPDPSRVVRLFNECLQNATFWNKTKLFFAFWTQYADIWRRSTALLRWISDLIEVLKITGKLTLKLRELASAFLAGYPWYQLAVLIADFVATIISMAFGGLNIIAKIVLCVVQLAKLTLKVLGLAGFIDWRARMIRAAA